MAAAAADNPVTGPVDSLEVRWIVPGLLRTAMRARIAHAYRDGRLPSD